MSDSVDLYVAGIGYTNNPAGTGGQKFRASVSGSEADVVWYQVDRSIVREAIFGEDIRRAYLDAQARSALDDQGVTYKSREAVEGAGMSCYVLWLDTKK